MFAYAGGQAHVMYCGAMYCIAMYCLAAREQLPREAHELGH